jgi:hypothetical protein
MMSDREFEAFMRVVSPRPRIARLDWLAITLLASGAFATIIALAVSLAAMGGDISLAS